MQSALLAEPLDEKLKHIIIYYYIAKHVRIQIEVLLVEIKNPLYVNSSTICGMEAN